MELTPVEVRVLGCLVEKQATTPEVYPLSTNALRLACNQRSSRDPVVDYDEGTVTAALISLRERGLARTVSGEGSRVYKHAHLLPEALGWTRRRVAVLSVLMLRGAQTAGELRARTERQHLFSSRRWSRLSTDWPSGSRRSSAFFPDSRAEGSPLDAPARSRAGMPQPEPSMRPSPRPLRLSLPDRSADRPGGRSGGAPRRARRAPHAPRGSRSAGVTGGYDGVMCRSIKTLRNLEPTATPEDVEAAALQFVRKVSGYHKPSRANEEAFDRAVTEVSAAVHRLLESLPAKAKAA